MYGAMGVHSTTSNIPCAHRIHAVPGPVAVGAQLPVSGTTAPHPALQAAERAAKPPCCLPTLLCSAPCCPPRAAFPEAEAQSDVLQSTAVLLGGTVGMHTALRRSAQQRTQHTQISRAQVQLYRALHPNMHASQGLAHSKVHTVQRIACSKVCAAAGIARTGMHIA